MRTTKIEWTDATWSPLRVRVRENAGQIAEAKGYTSLIRIAEKMRGRVGPHCEHVSPGCVNCYSGSNNHRCLRFNGTGLPFDRRSRDLVEPFVDEKILAQPLRWKKAQRVFVENQSDLFGEWLPDEAIDQVFAIMALCQHITFQCLTKRPERMMEYLSENHGHDARRRVQDILAPNGNRTSREAEKLFDNWPLRNCWLGVSCEDQKTADERIPLLLQTPAAVRFSSYEPALGPVDFSRYLQPHWTPQKGADSPPWLDWLICGGESGHSARPMRADWARSVRDQCQAAGVAFFFKQWGEWLPESQDNGVILYGRDLLHKWTEGELSFKAGKKDAGRLLDGVEWDEFPGVRA